MEMIVQNKTVNLKCFDSNLVCAVVHSDFFTHEKDVFIASHFFVHGRI